MADPNQDFIDAVNGQSTPAASPAGAAADPNQDFIDAAAASQAPQGGGSPTPETDKAMQETPREHFGQTRHLSPAEIQRIQNAPGFSGLMGDVAAGALKYTSLISPFIQFAEKGLPPTSPIRQATEGGVEGIRSAVRGATEMDNLALMVATGGVGGWGGRILSGAFAAQMLSQVPEQWKAFQEAPDFKTKVQMASALLTNVGFAGAGGKHALFGERAMPPPPIAPEATVTAPRFVKPGEEPVQPPVEETGEVGPVVEEGGEPDASTVSSTTPVGVRGEGGKVGAEAPLRHAGEAPGARPPSEPVSAAERPVAAATPTTPHESLIPTTETPTEAPNARITDFNISDVSSPQFEKTLERAALMNTRWIRLHYPDGSARNFKLDADYAMGNTEEPVTKGMGVQVKEGEVELPEVPPTPDDEKKKAAAVQPPVDRATELHRKITGMRQRGEPVPIALTQELEHLRTASAQKVPPPNEPTKLNEDETAELETLQHERAGLQNQLRAYMDKSFWEQRKLSDAEKTFHANNRAKIQAQLWDTWGKIHAMWEKSGQPYDAVIVGGGAGGLKAAGHLSYEGARVLVLEKAPVTGGQARRSQELFNVGAYGKGIKGRDYFDEKLRTAKNGGAQIKTGTEVVNLIPNKDGTVNVVTGVRTGKGGLVQTSSIPANRVILSMGADIVYHKGYELAGWGNGERLSQLSRGKTGMVYGAGNSSSQAVVGAIADGANHIVVVSRRPFGPEVSDNQRDRINAYVREGKATLVTGTIDKITANPDGTRTVHVGKSPANPNADYTFKVAHVENFLNTKVATNWLPSDIAKTKDGTVVVKDASFKTSMPGVYVAGDIRESLPGEERPRRIDMAEGDAAGIAARIRNEIEILRLSGKLPPWEKKTSDLSIDEQLKELKAKVMEEGTARAGITGSLPPQSEITSPGKTPESPPTSATKLPGKTPSSDPLVSQPPTPPVGTEPRRASPSETQQELRDNFLVESTKSKPRQLKPEEDAALMRRETALQGKADALYSDQIDAEAEGDFQRLAENDVRISEILDKLQDVRNARKSGKPPPDLNVAGDFSLEAMIKQKMAVKKGAALTPEENEEVQRAHDKIQSASQSVEAHKATPQAKQYWESLSKRAEAYRTGKGPLKPLIFDPAHLSKLAEETKAKHDWFDELERDRKAMLPWWKKTPDYLLKWRRAFVISGIHSIAKLASAAIEGTIILPVREAAGGVLGHLPLISEVAKRAPREGGFNIRAEAVAQAEMWKNLISDFGKNLKGQKPDYETVFGSFRNLPPELQNYVGYLHGALKSPLARNEFARSLEKRTEFAARHGADITDPLVQMELGRQAMEDSQFWRFQNKNIASGAYRKLVSSLQRQGVWGKTGATVIQGELPVVTVPTNILARTFEGVFGTIPGLARLGKAYARGIETLTPAEADLIMRNLKTGSIGLALTAVGFFAPQMFGGFYRPGVKKDPEDPSFGELKVGDTRIPAYLQDNPFLIMPQFGATMRQVADSYLRKRDTDTAGLWMGAWAAIMGAATSQPFVRESLDIVKAADPRSAGDVLGEHARSYLIPMAVQQVASMTDPAEKRYPEGFTQRIMMGIPGMRQQLPDIVPPPQQMGIRRRGVTPSRHLRAHR